MNVQIIYVGVYQYCFIRVLFTFVAMFTQLLGRYCESSLSPAFAHIWVLCFEAASVTVAMYCLIQFYIQLKINQTPVSGHLLGHGFVRGSRVHVILVVCSIS